MKGASKGLSLLALSGVLLGLPTRAEAGADAVPSGYTTPIPSIMVVLGLIRLPRGQFGYAGKSGKQIGKKNNSYQRAKGCTSEVASTCNRTFLTTPLSELQLYGKILAPATLDPALTRTSALAVLFRLAKWCETDLVTDMATCPKL